MISTVASPDSAGRFTLEISQQNVTPSWQRWGLGTAWLSATLHPTAPYLSLWMTERAAKSSRTTRLTLRRGEIAALKALLAHFDARPEVMPTIIDTRRPLDTTLDCVIAGGPLDAPDWLPAGSTSYFAVNHRVRPWACLREGTLA